LPSLVIYVWSKENIKLKVLHKWENVFYSETLISNTLLEISWVTVAVAVAVAATQLISNRI
jgi:hypothetical protein